MIIPNLWNNKSHVPNHQSAIFVGEHFFVTPIFPALIYQLCSPHDCRKILVLLASKKVVFVQSSIY